MITDIFIRTYVRDLEFLGHAIRSIEERVIGYRNLIITCPHHSAARISRAIGRNAIGVEPLRDDYIGQQLTKMQAPRYTDADVICYWDSDAVATQPLNLSDLLFSGDKLILHHVPYAGLSDGSQIWRDIVTRDMGAVPEFEFMRRLPLAYHRSTIDGCAAHIEQVHGALLRDYVSRLPLRSFTEFNCIGAWAYEHEQERYDFRVNEGEVLRWKSLVKQFWSWGGITREVRDELRQMSNK
jgi:hypothetical protein